jgi:hypothetical protein
MFSVFLNLSQIEIEHELILTDELRLFSAEYFNRKRNEVSNLLTSRILK